MILVDYREPNVLVEKLRIPFKKCNLSVGDYIIGECVVERKTRADFFFSLQDNRLWNQLTLMSRTYKNSYLLFEGYASYKVMNILNYASVYYRVLPLFSKDIQQTASILNSIFILSKKPQPNLLVPHQIRFAKPQLSILYQFPDIGIKTSRELLFRFETLSRIFNASHSELREVLDKKQYKSFRETLDDAHCFLALPE